MPVDPYRFIDRPTRTMIQSWIAREPRREIPWTPLPRPLARCKLAVLSSAGLALNEDQPFDRQGEHDNPWRGDPGFRVIPREATEADLTCYHLHIDPRPAQQDHLWMMGEGFDRGLSGRSPTKTPFSFAIFGLKEYNSCTATVVKALLEALCQ